MKEELSCDPDLYWYLKENDEIIERTKGEILRIL